MRSVLWPLVVDALAPSTCFSCGARLGRHQGFGACLSCWSSLNPLRPGEPAPIPAHLDGWCVAVRYEGAARRFVLRAKEAGRRELFVPLARILVHALRARAARVDCIVPVPSSHWNRLRRGYSPAKELARELGRLTGVPLRSVLRRRGWRDAQKRRRAHERSRVLRRFDYKRVIDGASVLLVDDVVTTGSTLGACAAALRAAGASRVHAAVWAATPLRS